jgi:hypothetical protein
LRTERSRGAHNSFTPSQESSTSEWSATTSQSVLDSALQRTLRHIADPACAPLGWFDWDCGRSFEVPCDHVPLADLHDFLRGRSKRFLEELETARAAESTCDLAQQNLVLNDLILLEEFYEKGPLRNRLIKENEELVTPEELVDWLAVKSA